MAKVAPKPISNLLGTPLSPTLEALRTKGIFPVAIAFCANRRKEIIFFKYIKERVKASSLNLDVSNTYFELFTCLTKLKYRVFELNSEPVRDIKSEIEAEIMDVTVIFRNFQLETVYGTIQVHQSLANDIASIFQEIHDVGFPIHSVRKAEDYDFCDLTMAKHNNSSGYLFRTVKGRTVISDHGYGFAVDINPLQNPYVHPSGFNISRYNANVKGTIVAGSPVVEIFKKYEWLWGGDWKHPDYQHFYKPCDEIRKRISW